MVLNDRLWHGSHGSGPEIGHLTIQPNGDRCRCGNRGCLETLASASWLVQRAILLQKSQKTGPGDPVGLLGATEAFTAKDLFQWALQGDPESLGLFRKLGQALGLAIANLVTVLSLDGVIIGGGVSRAATIFLPYLEKEFRKRLTLVPPERVQIRISGLQEKSGVLGAAGIALERIKPKL